MTWLIAVAAAALAVALGFSFRFAWWRRRVDYRWPRILMYHMVRQPLPGCRFNKLRVAPEAFERQLQWLVDRGWRFAFLSELAELEDAEKTVVLTFDDGYRDNYLAAHPLLLKYGAKATLFLVIDRHDRDWSRMKKASHDSGELRAEPKLSDDDVQAMLDSGVWQLGAHTLTHALLPALDDADRRSEIGGSKEILQSRFNVAVDTFAYPFGIYDDRDVAAVAATGYRYAVTTEPGISAETQSEALRLKRIKVSSKDNLLVFALRMRTGRRSLNEGTRWWLPQAVRTRRGRRRGRAGLASVLLAASAVGLTLATAADSPPADMNLHYDVQVAWIQAGQIILRFSPGDDRYTLSGTVTTSRFMDRFFKWRGRFVATGRFSDSFPRTETYLLWGDNGKRQETLILRGDTTRITTSEGESRQLERPPGSDFMSVTFLAPHCLPSTTLHDGEDLYYLRLVREGDERLSLRPPFHSGPSQRCDYEFRYDDGTMRRVSLWMADWQGRRLPVRVRVRIPLLPDGVMNLRLDSPSSPATSNAQAAR